MIFNKENNGVAEIHALTGSYYRNNNFAAIRPHIIDETREIVRYIGRDMYERAEKHYYSKTFNPNWSDSDRNGKTYREHKLVTMLQTAIALMAIFRYNQSNIVGHEDTGRKLKFDNDHEKLPWEWMLDRDDAAMLRRAYLAIDNLIDFLELNKFPEWMKSENRTLVRSLFIATCKEFNRVYPIDESARFFYELAPFIREAQVNTLPDAMKQEVYNNLLHKYIRNTEMTDDEKHLLSLVQSYLPLRTIEIACSRLSVSVFPEGVVQRFLSGGSAGRHAANIASDETLRRYAHSIGKQADTALDNIKRFIQKISADKLVYPIMPKNDRRNKYFIM